MEIFNLSKPKSIYSDLITHYQLNRISWDDLADHQQIVLISTYKRHNNTNNDDLVIMDLRRILNGGNVKNIANNMRSRLAI